MIELPVLGKGCYIWRHENIYNGSIEKIVQGMLDAKVQHVCLKVSNGSSCWSDLYPSVKALSSALWQVGIKVGAWGYQYLKWNPIAEATALARGANAIVADYILMDVEDSSSFWQWTNGSRFVNKLRTLCPNIPIALNTYWKPSWHKEIPYDKIRKVSDFDAPQTYYRNQNPEYVYKISKAEYSNLRPILPFSLPAGDMYFEFGIRPKKGDILKFMQIARKDPDNKGVCMWSADQRETTPDMWAEFSSYDWNADVVDIVVPDPQPELVPMYAAVVTASIGLNVRATPSMTGIKVGTLIRGYRVEVYSTSGLWSNIGEDKWVYSHYLTRM